MTHTVAVEESQLIAQELYSVIKSLESSKWKAELDSVKLRLDTISDRLHTAIEAADLPDAGEHVRALRARLETLQKLVEDSMPSVDLKGEWRAYRKSLVPEYEALAASLKVQDVHLPSLRPTNYTRNIFHIACGVVVLVLIQHLMTMDQLRILAAAGALSGWAMEIGRRKSKLANKVLMGVFKHVAHPHEQYRINSSTWYTTGLLILSLLASPLVSSLAVIVLAFSDPAAALIGRKFGRTKLHAGRSLEGTLTFTAVGIVASLTVLSIYYPDLTMLQMLVIAAAGTIPGALAELFSQRIDDNLSIPMSVAAGATVACLLLGVAI